MDVTVLARRAKQRSSWSELVGWDWSLPVVLAVFVGAVAVWLRVMNLNTPEAGPFGNEYDEGTYLGQLDLVAAGFRPIREIYTTQGPLLLHYFYPFYAVADADLAGTRIGATFASTVSLLAIWLIAWQLGGPWAGTWALLLAVTSTLYLQFSRMVLAEIPSIAPALVAVVLVLQYQHTQRRWCLYVSAVLFAVGLLVKPMTVVNGVPILALLIRRDRWAGVADLTRWAATCLLVVIGTVLVVGPLELLEPFITFRRQAFGLGAAGQRSWSIDANLRLVSTALRSDPPWLVLSALSVVPLWLTSRAFGMLVLTWAAVVVLMLVLYSPIASKHVVYLVPPVAVLAGIGISAAGRQFGRRVILTGGVALIAVALFWWFPPSPTQMSIDRASAWQAKDGSEFDADGDVADVLQFVSAASTPDEYIITDDHWLAYLAHRKQPPRLADLSATLIRAGIFDDEDLIGQAKAFRPALVVFWANRASRLSGFGAWVSREYALVRQYDDERAAYVRRDLVQRVSEFGARGDRPDSGADFGSELTLDSSTILAGPRSGMYAVEQSWRARDLVTDGYMVSVEIRVPQSGAVAWREDERLLPRWHRASWPEGGTLVQRRTADATALPPGRYLVTTTVHLQSDRKLLRTTLHRGSQWAEDRDRRFVVLGEIHR